MDLGPTTRAVLGTADGKAHESEVVVVSESEVVVVNESEVVVVSDSEAIVVSESEAVVVSDSEVVVAMPAEVVSASFESLALLALIALKTEESIQSTDDTATLGKAPLKKAEIS